MTPSTNSLLLVRAGIAVSFVAMVAMNYLAVALPLNGKSTGELSDAYPNLFTPAGYTFSIWGLIYLLLGAYVLYRLGVFRDRTNAHTERILRRMDSPFLLTSAANVAWIFSWHYEVVWLSLVCMLILLGALITIADRLRVERLSTRDTAFIRVPLGVYFGWITVATIANVTALLVHLGWDGFGISASVWTVVVLLVGAGIGLARLHRDRCGAYGLVLIWAYGGILQKHTAADAFAGAYPAVIWTTALCMLLFLLGVGMVAKDAVRGERRLSAV